MPAEGSGQEPGAPPPSGPEGHWPANPPEGAAGGTPPMGYPDSPAMPPTAPEAMPPYGMPPHGPPYGSGYAPPPYGYSYMAAPPPMAPTTSGWATASLICSIAGFCTAGLGCIAGVICGHIALGQINASQGRVEGRALAIAGLVLGYAGIALYVLIVIGIIAALASLGPVQ
ncbi:MAG TPA: DUF4190 domain-containing protein [Ktedonobacterales bacterium]